MSLRDRLTKRLFKIAASRDADVYVGGRERPYMKRWWLLPKNRFFNLYLHQFLRSDEDRALHDHPWWNLSILMVGEYTEHTIAAGGINEKVIRRVGDWKLRGAKSAHRIDLHAGPCWTIFVTGPELRDWGFHCSQKGWVNRPDFDKTGCGE